MPMPDSSCHHCHIHAPIPARDLKRTHPLRSYIEPPPSKNVSFLYRSGSKDGGTPRGSSPRLKIPIPPPPPLPPASLRSSLPPQLPPASLRSLHSHHSSDRSQTSTRSLTPPRSLPSSRSVTPPKVILDSRPALVVDSQLPSPNGKLPPKIILKGVVRRRQQKGLVGLQAVLLVGAYALLLVLAVVVGVVLTQDRRSGRPQSGQGPLQPRPIFRAQGPGGGGPVRIQGRPRPRPEDIELLPNPISAQPAPRGPTSIPIDPPAFRAPPPGFSQNNPPPPRRPAPAQRPQQPLSAVDGDFALDSNHRGQKEPAVKILRSWSHHNADGTFSWGYINDDGSFKNETRGHDCVVRGVYGYVDTETGEQLSFPYETGNVCDPNEPDYYDYYDGTGAALDDFGEARSTVSGSGPLARRFN